MSITDQRAYLRQLHAITIGKETAALPVESYLYNLLFEVPMPSPGKTVNFSGGSCCVGGQGIHCLVMRVNMYLCMAADSILIDYLTSKGPIFMHNIFTPIFSVL